MTSLVYVHVAADGSVLYVGCTGNPLSRFADHRSSSAWWPDVDKVEIAGFGVTGQMRALERALIETFDPPYNTVHTSAWREASRPAWARPKDAPVDEAHVEHLIASGFKPDSARRYARRLDRVASHSP